MKKTLLITCITLVVGGVGWSSTIDPVEPMYAYREAKHELPDPSNPDGTTITRCLFPGNTCRYTDSPLD